MTDKIDNDTFLDGLFDAARDRPATPSAELSDRVLGDAYAVMPQAPDAAPDAAPVPARRAGFGGVWAMLGGWPTFGGLATAALLGVWIGFSPGLGIGNAMNDVFAGLGGIEGSDAYLVDIDPLAALGLAEGDAG